MLKATEGRWRGEGGVLEGSGVGCGLAAFLDLVFSCRCSWPRIELSRSRGGGEARFAVGTYECSRSWSCSANCWEEKGGGEGKEKGEEGGGGGGGGGMRRGGEEGRRMARGEEEEEVEEEVEEEEKEERREEDGEIGSMARRKVSSRETR